VILDVFGMVHNYLKTRRIEEIRIVSQNLRVEFVTTISALKMRI